MVLKKFKLPGAPTMSNVLVEDGGSGGGVEIIESVYIANPASFIIERPIGEIIDLFESGKTILIKIAEDIDHDIKAGTYLIYGAYYDEYYNRYVLATIFGAANSNRFKASTLNDNPVMMYGII